MKHESTKTKSEPTCQVTIYVAGNYEDALRICNKHCTEVGLCVTVSRTDFSYSYGMESGVMIGLVNYPRFPSTKEEVNEKANELAEKLMYELCQRTALVVGPEITTWLYREDVHTANKKSN